MSKDPAMWRDRLSFGVACTLATFCFVTEMPAAALDLQSGYLAYLAADAKRHGEKIVIREPDGGRPAMTQPPDEFFRTWSTLLVTASDTSGTLVVTPDNINTWYRFTSKRILAARPLGPDGETHCPVGVPSAVPIRTGEIVVSRHEGIADVDGVRIVERMDPPIFVRGRQYLMLGDLCQSGRLITWTETIFPVDANGRLSYAIGPTGLSDFVLTLRDVAGVEKYLRTLK